MSCIQINEQEFANEMTTRQKTLEQQRKVRMGAFFQTHRINAGIGIEVVANALEFDDLDMVRQIESGEKAIPIDDVFVLTNVLNIPPDDVAQLIHDVFNKS